MEDGTFKDGIVKFKRTYSSSHGVFKIVSTFTGTETENVIKGTIEYKAIEPKYPFPTRSEKWEAKRAARH
jgi:hypothetical protein